MGETQVFVFLSFLLSFFFTLEQQDFMVITSSVSSLKVILVFIWKLHQVHFVFLINSPWPLVFALCLFFLFLLGFNLYCLKGIHFSWSNSLMVLQLHLFLGLIFCSNIWFRDLLREFVKKYE